MGILNVTPDSFSDGGDYLDQDGLDHERAIARAEEMVAQGADIIDIGGESTRPGAEPVSVEEELNRVLGVVDAMASADVHISIDTTKPAVAAAAIEAGAHIINDVSGFRDDAMVETAAASGAACIVMHMQGEPRTMQSDPVYDDVVADVSRYLNDQAAVLREAGVHHQSIAIDPGIGFGKTLEHNLALHRNLDRLVASGYPVALGTSRKSFLGKLLGDAEPHDRDIASAASVVAAIAAGVAVVRVHNVTLCSEAALVAGAIVGRE